MVKQLIYKSMLEVEVEVISDSEILLNNIDSMDFVNLVILVEEKIFKETNKQITLVNDKAFSMRSNPFKTIQTMTDYIEGLL